MINLEIFKYKCCYTCSFWELPRMLGSFVNPCTKVNENTRWSECCKYYVGSATKDNFELTKERVIANLHSRRYCVLVECSNKNWDDMSSDCRENCELYKNGECDNGFVPKELLGRRGEE